MSWLLIALVPPALFAVSNHIDKYLVDRFMREASPQTLLVSTALAGIVFMPFIALFRANELLISPTNTALIITSGILFAIGFIPYLRALQHDEASVVAPLFQLSPIFAFVLGYALLGETLTVRELLGCAIIIAGAFLISIDTAAARFRVRWRTLGLIALASFTLSLSGVLFKFVTVSEDFWITTFWEYVGSGLVGAFWLLQKNIRSEFARLVRQYRMRFLALNIATDFISSVGGLVLRYATLLVPIAVAWTMNGFLPVFVFLYGVILTVFLPSWGKETLSPRAVAQKLFSIALMIFGTYVINA